MNSTRNHWKRVDDTLSEAERTNDRDESEQGRVYGLAMRQSEERKYSEQELCMLSATTMRAAALGVLETYLAMRQSEE